MSVDLCCPNCGASVGYADSDDNYKEKYYKNDGNGKPECPNCGAGESTSNFENSLLIGGLVFMGILILLVILIPILLTN